MWKCRGLLNPLHAEKIYILQLATRKLSITGVGMSEGQSWQVYIVASQSMVFTLLAYTEHWTTEQYPHAVPLHFKFQVWPPATKFHICSTLLCPIYKLQHALHYWAAWAYSIVLCTDGLFDFASLGGVAGKGIGWEIDNRHMWIWRQFASTAYNQLK